jgi:hypothetical protein
MANRSYIYGIKNGKHISIGEYPYAIPYAFRILAAFDNQVEDSHLFDKVVGIKADFEKGKKALYDLLDFLVATNEMKDHAEFIAEVAKTKQYLDAIQADETLLENGEIYALYTKEDGSYLDGEGLEKANTHACQDYKWLGEDVTNVGEYGITPNNLFHLTHESAIDIYGWMMGLKENWKDKLGLDAWRDVLYFQFKSGD